MLNALSFDEIVESQHFLDAVLSVLRQEKGGTLYSYMYGGAISEDDAVHSDEDWHDFLDNTDHYYMLKEEAGVIEKAGQTLSSVIPSGLTSIELALGDETATSSKSLAFNQAVKPSRFVGVDINPDYANNGAQKIGKRLGIPYQGIEADILDGQPIAFSEPAVFSLFGGLLANLPSVQGIHHLDMLALYMGRLRQMMKVGDYFVVTQDSCHNPEKLRDAYNDPLLAACALSILHRIKRDLPTKGFNPENFEYVGIFHPKSDNEALCVRSKTVQSFQIAGQSIVLPAGRIIPLINSYKFMPSDFREATKRSGFIPVINPVRYGDLNLHAFRAI